jgi:23S rRNA (uracil1939-C5)-methyltransferase
MKATTAVEQKFKRAAQIPGRPFRERPPFKRGSSAGTHPIVVNSDIASLATGGDGVGRLEDGRTLFVPGTAPGDRAEVRVVEEHKNYARGKLRRVLSAGRDRVAPPCPVAGECGGCAWQHLSYPSQVSAKAGFLREALRRIGGLEQPPVSGVLAAAHPLGYRNKAQVPVALAPDGSLRMGYYREGSHDVVPLPEEGCRLLAPAVDQALLFVREHLPELGLAPYEQTKGQGSLRHVMVRADSKGRAMVVLVTREAVPKAAAELAERWVGQAGIVSVQNNLQSKTGNVILGAETRVLAGPESLDEDLGGLSYRLSATSFFQVNREQTLALISAILGIRPWKAGESVLELYCGVGTLSLPLGRLGLRLHGVENHPAAVADAQANALANALPGLSFSVADALGAWQNLPAGFEPTVALMDPPRKGLEPGLAALLAQKGPPELVYVSCDPASLARDVKLLAAGGYRLLSCQGVDLFPQTAHVESVSLLARAS